MSAWREEVDVRGGLPVAPVERVPPASGEAEEHVLACCLMDGHESIERVLRAGVNAKTFHLPKTQVLFEVIVDLFRRSPPVTLAMVVEELQTRRQLEAVGGMPWLLQVTDPGKVSSTAFLGYFIDKVRELAARRWLIRESMLMTDAAYAYTGPDKEAPAGMEDVLRGHISTLARGLQHVVSADRMPKSLAAEIGDVKADFVARVAGKQDRSGWIYTGIPEFDDKLLPLGCQRDDHYIVVGGGSGDGKSVLMMQVAGAALESENRHPDKVKQRVRVYSAETSTGGFIARLVASWTGVDLRHPELARPEVRAKFEAECDRLAAEVADKRLWCVQQNAATPIRTIEDLAEDARMFAKLQGAPHLWVVDYAQLFSTRKRCASREQENAHISGTFQALQRELGGVWLVGCQLNEAGLREQRALKKDDKGRVIHRLPNRGDLRESQKYYHDADRVIFIYRPPEDCRGQEQSLTTSRPEQWLVQDKRRQGGNGYVRCWFEKNYTRFAPFSREDSASADRLSAQTTGTVPPKARVDKSKYL